MARNTSYVFVQGKIKYPRLVVPDTKYEAKWNLSLYPTPDSLEIIRNLQAKGLKNRLRKDEDGYNVNFGRPTQVKRKDGRVIGFNPPEVFTPDMVPFDGKAIGNGSDVTVKLEVYEHKTPGDGTAIAARLYSVRVDNLVPYEPTRDSSAETQQAAKGLPEQPPQLF